MRSLRYNNVTINLSLQFPNMGQLRLRRMKEGKGLLPQGAITILRFVASFCDNINFYSHKNNGFVSTERHTHFGRVWLLMSGKGPLLRFFVLTDVSARLNPLNPPFAPVSKTGMIFRITLNLWSLQAKVFLNCHLPFNILCR